MYSEYMYGLGAQPSPIRQLFEYGVQKAKEIGPENVFDFTLGGPSVPPPAVISETWKELLATEDATRLHAYTSAIGRIETRQAIVDNLNKRFGTAFTPDCLYLTCGAAASLTSSIRALCTSPEDEFIILAPYFPEYETFVLAQGAKVVIVPAKDDFRLNLEALADAITDKTQGIIVNSPNNPSGKVYSREEIEALASLLEEKSKAFAKPIYIISDEPYRELVYADIEVPFIPKFYRNTIVNYSFSKIFSLPGERLGYVLVPADIDDAKEIYKAVAGAARAQGYVCAPAMAQRVIERCIDAEPKLSVYELNRSLLYDGLSAMGYTCVAPDGAFYLFVKAPNGDAEAFSALAKEQNLLIVPGTGFGCPDYLRISYCVSTDTVKRAMPVFETLIKSL